MSDRFVFKGTQEEIEQQFNVRTERSDFFESHFNITPGSRITVVYHEEERKIYQFRWGLIPPDAEEERAGNENYETTLDVIEENEWLTECLSKRRCLIPAHGFYKWKTTEKKSTPFFIRLLSNELMALAGIYSIWKSSTGRDVYSCAVLTTEANALIQPVGDRMPAILDTEQYTEWLGDDQLDEQSLNRLIKPFPMSKMAVNRVSEKVNDTDNNNPELIQPIPK
jgi:putative SOS response-associated peptidase YedK